MTNAEWMIKNGYKFGGLSVVYEKSEEDDGRWAWHIQHLKAGIDEIMDSAYANTLTNWLDAEHKEPILDESEREYLSAVIKPFRQRVEYIVKSSEQKEWIKISLGLENVYLPSFKIGTMYKGMKPNMKYSLKELGL